MKIKAKAMGEYQTNCYIVTVDEMDFIIDPHRCCRVGYAKRDKPDSNFKYSRTFRPCLEQCRAAKETKNPLYTPKEDTMLLQGSSWSPDLPPSKPDVEVEPNQEFNFNGVKVKFRHFPGHTPGCSTIEIGDAMFSGDFIFERSIGRTDFPYSSPQQMRESLREFKKIPYDKTIYPGHGNTTTIKQEQQYSDYWIANL